MSEFKDFRLGSFFNSHLGYKVDKLLSSGSYKVISGVTENNGILGYVNDVGNSKIFTDTITISNRGENSGKAYYQKDDFILSNNAIALEKKLHVKNQLSKHVILYLTASINKLNYGGYGNYPTKAGILEDVLSLPVKSLTDTEPDWEYMEQYIKDIEKKAILKVKEQNEKDIALLKEIIGQEKGSDFSEDVEFREFNVGDLFEIFTGGDLILGKTDVGSIPVVSHQNTDNGVSKRISEIKGRTIYDFKTTLALADRGTFFASVQHENFYIGTRVKALKINNSVNVTKYIMMYLATSINKHSVIFEKYSDNATNKLPELKITLPVNKNASEQVPDWETMEEYMKHIQQKYITLKEQENEREINNLLTVTGLTSEILESGNEQIV